jgi:hypothetical protein
MESIVKRCDELIMHYENELNAMKNAIKNYPRDLENFFEDIKNMASVNMQKFLEAGHNKVLRAIDDKLEGLFEGYEVKSSKNTTSEKLDQIAMLLQEDFDYKYKDTKSEGSLPNFDSEIISLDSENNGVKKSYQKKQTNNNYKYNQRIENRDNIIIQDCMDNNSNRTIDNQQSSEQQQPQQQQQQQYVHHFNRQRPQQEQNYRHQPQGQKRPRDYNHHKQRQELNHQADFQQQHQHEPQLQSHRQPQRQQYGQAHNQGGIQKQSVVHQKYQYPQQQQRQNINTKTIIRDVQQTEQNHLNTSHSII